MRLRQSILERQGGSTKVSTAWTDQMRRPSTVTISIEKNAQSAQIAPSGILCVGEDRDVTGVLNGIAEIAWNAGWRPAGLANRVMGAIAAHKVSAGE